MISFRTYCTSSKWKMRSNSQTFSNARSRLSTKTWIRSRMPSSLSAPSTTNLAVSWAHTTANLHEVQRRIVAVYDSRVVVCACGAIPWPCHAVAIVGVLVARGRGRKDELGGVEEVADTRWPVGNKREDLGNESLLRQRRHRRVELGQARLPWLSVMRVQWGLPCVLKIRTAWIMTAEKRLYLLPVLTLCV